MSRETGCSSAIVAIGLNLDFNEYLLFKSYTPAARMMRDGQIVFTRGGAASKDQAVVQRCLTFATNAVLRLESGH